MGANIKYLLNSLKSEKPNWLAMLSDRGFTFEVVTRAPRFPKGFDKAPDRKRLKYRFLFDSGVLNPVNRQAGITRQFDIIFCEEDKKELREKGVEESVLTSLKGVLALGMIPNSVYPYRQIFKLLKQKRAVHLQSVSQILTEWEAEECDQTKKAAYPRQDLVVVTDKDQQKNQAEIEIRRVPLQDFLPAGQDRFAIMACEIDRIHSNLQNGHLHYTHCKAGVGRSASLIACYMAVKVFNYDPQAAINWLNAKRRLADGHNRVVYEFSAYHLLKQVRLFLEKNDTQKVTEYLKLFCEKFGNHIVKEGLTSFLDRVLDEPLFDLETEEVFADGMRERIEEHYTEHALHYIQQERELSAAYYADIRRLPTNTALFSTNGDINTAAYCEAYLLEMHAAIEELANLSHIELSDNKLSNKIEKKGRYRKANSLCCQALDAFFNMTILIPQFKDKPEYLPEFLDYTYQKQKQAIYALRGLERYLAKKELYRTDSYEKQNDRLEHLALQITQVKKEIQKLPESKISSNHPPVTPTRQRTTQHFAYIKEMTHLDSNINQFIEENKFLTVSVRAHTKPQESDEREMILKENKKALFGSTYEPKFMVPLVETIQKIKDRLEKFKNEQHFESRLTLISDISEFEKARVDVDYCQRYIDQWPNKDKDEGRKKELTDKAAEINKLFSHFTEQFNRIGAGYKVELDRQIKQLQSPDDKKKIEQSLYFLTEVIRIYKEIENDTQIEEIAQTNLKNDCVQEWYRHLATIDPPEALISLCDKEIRASILHFWLHTTNILKLDTTIITLLLGLYNRFIMDLQPASKNSFDFIKHFKENGEGLGLLKDLNENLKENINEMSLELLKVYEEIKQFDLTEKYARADLISHLFHFAKLANGLKNAELRQGIIELNQHLWTLFLSDKKLSLNEIYQYLHEATAILNQINGADVRSIINEFREEVLLAFINSLENELQSKANQVSIEEERQARLKSLEDFLPQAEIIFLKDQMNSFSEGRGWVLNVRLDEYEKLLDRLAIKIEPVVSILLEDQLRTAENKSSIGKDTSEPLTSSAVSLSPTSASETQLSASSANLTMRAQNGDLLREFKKRYRERTYMDRRSCMDQLYRFFCIRALLYKEYTENDITWDNVVEYAKKKPRSRTNEILNDILNEKEMQDQSTHYKPG